MSSALVVDDDPSCAELMALVLRQEGIEVRMAENGLAALLAIEDSLPDVVFSDIQMPEMSGIDLLARIKQRWPRLPVIMVSVREEVAIVVDAVQRGAMNYITKPCSPHAIADAARKALSKQARAQERPDDVAARVIGRSKAMVQVRQQIILAARNDANVLLVGPTGSGKEMVARDIHANSSSAMGPFIAHNCAATPRELFSSVFFGHVAGAFTGAGKAQVGLLQQAHGGTFFLDELEAMDLNHQAHLLRVLDDGEVRPVGGAQPRHVSVRFIAATNCAPQELLRKRVLREDLYYRLRGMEIVLPPLNRRREDILLLARHFLGRNYDRMSAAARDSLLAHDWPGNVRELKNVLRTAASLAGEGPIDIEELQVAPATARLAPGTPSAIGLVPTLKEGECELIRKALALHKGNLVRAARALGIDRSTLRRKIAAMERPSDPLANHST